MRGKVIKLLTGQKVGNLLIGDVHSIRTTYDGRNYVRYKCVCDCGNFCIIPHNQIIKIERGTKSCGCLKVKIGREINTTHGLKNHRVYSIWCGMKDRCYNKNSKSYPNYGGKGITVCDRWLHSFENFLEDMGMPPEKHSLNRINGARQYSKENCEWATDSIQCYDQNVIHRNKSGKVGVCYDIESGKWLAYISKDGKQMKLGRFSSFEAAVEVRLKAELDFYGKTKQGEDYDI